jgi:hypothetical protein
MGNSFPNPVYVDDILLASNDVNLLHEKKKFLSLRFNKNILGEMSLVIELKLTEIEERNIRTIAWAYLEKILKK